jgi:uncharacterized protein
MRVPVTGLLGRPGERRELVKDVAPEEFGPEPWGPTFEELVGPVSLALTLEAVSEGVLVRGTVRATPQATCARCLTPVHLEQISEVTELHRAVTAPGARRGRRAEPAFTEDELDEDAAADDLDYELIDGDTALDLDRMVRDAVVVGQPVRVLCREDCAGLCPTCGADRNTEACQHGEERPIDPRWEVLRALRLPDASGPQGTG